MRVGAVSSFTRRGVNSKVSKRLGVAMGGYVRLLNSCLLSLCFFATQPANGQPGVVEAGGQPVAGDRIERQCTLGDVPVKDPFLEKARNDIVKRLNSGELSPEISEALQKFLEACQKFYEREESVRKDLREHTEKQNRETETMLRLALLDWAESAESVANAARDVVSAMEHQFERPNLYLLYELIQNVEEQAGEIQKICAFQNSGLNPEWGPQANGLRTTVFSDIQKIQRYFGKGYLESRQVEEKYNNLKNAFLAIMFPIVGIGSLFGVAWCVALFSEIVKSLADDIEI